jgi:multidrug efflux pump subunit AcrB
MHLLGFSINMLTLFGMILAIGLVVDGRHRGGRERRVQHHGTGLAPLEAAKRR